MAAVSKLFSIPTTILESAKLKPLLSFRWRELQNYLQTFAADHTHSGGPDGAFITGAFDEQGSSRTYTNTSFLDLDALTGGSGSISAVAASLTSVVDHNVLVAITAIISNSNGGATGRVGFRISGATTLAAVAGNSFSYESSNANDSIRASWIGAFNVNAGTNTFEMQANVTSGTGSIDDTRITVIPFS